MPITPGELTPIRVVLTTFNGDQWLPVLLESIARQTVAPDEILVFDDRSTDGTLEVLEAFVASHPGQVTVTRRPATLGASANFVDAIEGVTGGVVVLCDQDDVWCSDRIERSQAALTEADGVFSDGVLVDEAGRALGRTLWAAAGFTGRRRRAWTSDALGVLLQGNVVTGATLSFRRRSLDRFLPLSRRGWHDLSIAVLLAAGGRLVAEPQPLIAYRLHGGNTAGLRAFTLAGRRRARSAHLAALAEVTAQFAELECALSLANLTAAARRVAGKGAHLQRRLAMPDQRTARAMPAIRELARGHYHRYGSGFGSAAQDLFNR